MGYASEAIKGISWSLTLRGILRLVTFVRISALARALTPTQFGIFSIISLVLSLIEILTETGINIFLVQQKEHIKVYLDTAWVASILRGFIIGLAIFLLTPFIARFYNTANVITPLYFIAIVPIIRGFINPSIAVFQKEMKFNNELYFRSTIFIFESSIAILFAFITHNIISLVWGLIASAFLEVFLSFLLISPRPRTKFNMSQLKEIVNYGKWVSGSGIFTYFFYNIDNIAVGKILGITALGYYDNAYKISMLPITEIGDVITKVTLPFYIKIKDDISRLKQAYIVTLVATTFVVIPIGLLIFFFAKWIVLIILGPHWMAAIPVLQILAIFGVIRTLVNTTTSLFYAVGKQTYVTIITFTSFALLAITIVPFIMYFGLLGAGYSAVFSSVALIPLSTFFIFRIFYQGKRI